MPLESATYIHQLDSNNPVGSDPVAFVDDHLRLIKASLKATFPNITGPVNATQDALNTPFPQGGIIMWSGASVPSGWKLCDGTNGTPDLRDRFIVGAGTSYALGSSGGSKDAVVVSHSHTATTSGNSSSHSHTFSGNTDSSGNHTHYAASSTPGSGWGPLSADSVIPSGNTSDGGNWQYAFGNNATVANVGLTSSAGSHSHTISGTTAAATDNHTHGVTVQSSGESGIDKNLPPYYALAYIMKS